MIGILIALKEEINLNSILKKYQYKDAIINSKEFFELTNNEIILAFSGVGKVNAAITTQMLIDKYKVSEIINIGTAGTNSSKININDICIPEIILYSDVDVTAFKYKLNQIPGQQVSYISSLSSNNKLKKILQNINENFVIHDNWLQTADSFVNQKNYQKFKFYNNVIIDMEGCAIAQTCVQNDNLPFSCIKFISDNINHNKPNEKMWTKFVKNKKIIINKLIDRLSCKKLN